MKKKILWGVSIVTILILMLFFVLLSLELVKQKDCNQYHIEVPENIKEKVDVETLGLTEFQIVDYCVDLTAELLRFSFDQDKLFSKPVCNAHCVTYAQLCSTLCNIAFEKHDLGWSAKRVRGYVALYGVDLCKVLSNIFPKHINCVKDHDFVEVVGLHHTVYVDASMKDVIFTDLKMIKKAN